MSITLMNGNYVDWVYKEMKKPQANICSWLFAT